MQEPERKEKAEEDPTCSSRSVSALNFSASAALVTRGRASVCVRVRLSASRLAFTRPCQRVTSSEERS